MKEKQAEGWDVCVVATPHGAQWFDVDQVEKLTGHKVRVNFWQPHSPNFQPLGDAVLLAPATFNTINKWALGINDTLALGLLNEAVGRNVPVTIIPVVNGALAGHPAFGRALEQLEKLGVSIAREQ